MIQVSSGVRKALLSATREMSPSTTRFSTVQPMLSGRSLQRHL